MTNYIFVVLSEKNKNKKNKAVIYKEYASVACKGVGKAI